MSPGLDLAHRVATAASRFHRRSRAIRITVRSRQRSTSLESRRACVAPACAVLGRVTGARDRPCSRVSWPKAATRWTTSAAAHTLPPSRLSIAWATCLGDLLGRPAGPLRAPPCARSGGDRAALPRFSGLGHRSRAAHRFLQRRAPVPERAVPAVALSPIVSSVDLDARRATVQRGRTFHVKPR